MINAQDLRIGNLVNTVVSIGYNPAGIVKVTSISAAYGINVWCDHGAGGWGKFEDLEGIPLSPEWLERCGFDYDMITYSLDRFWIAYGDGKWDVFLHGLYNGITTSIKHLHQLQNIFYALTGQELTIKEIA